MTNHWGVGVFVQLEMAEICIDDKLSDHLNVIRGEDVETKWRPLKEENRVINV